MDRRMDRHLTGQTDGRMMEGKTICLPPLNGEGIKHCEYPLSSRTMKMQMFSFPYFFFFFFFLYACLYSISYMGSPEDDICEC